MSNNAKRRRDSLFSFRLPSEWLTRLRTMASARGTTAGAVIREAVEAQLDPKPSVNLWTAETKWSLIEGIGTRTVNGAGSSQQIECFRR